MCLFKFWSMVLFGMCLFFVGLGGFLIYSSSVFFFYYNMSWGVSYMDFVLVFDWVGVVFLSVVLLISLAVMFYSSEYMGGDLSSGRFCYLVLLFILSMGLLVLSPNLMSLLLGWDGLGLISYCLVIYYQNVSSFNAGMLTVLSNRIGDVGILLGIVIMVNLGEWGIVSVKYFNSGGWEESILYSMVFLAAMTKSAQVPFSSWLPAAMAAPTPVSSLVHSSTLVTAGVFLLIRFQEMFLLGGFQVSLMYLSLGTLVMSGVGACFEMDFSSVIALSTLSQLALMMFSLSLGLWEVSYFHMLTHAMFSALLFLCAGSVIHSMGGGQDIRALGALCGYSPVVGCGMLISMVSLMGVPFASGFYSKDLIIEMFLLGSKNIFCFVMFFLGVVSTVVYSMRLVYYILLNYYSGLVFTSYSESSAMDCSILLLGFVGVMFGSSLQWLMFDYELLVVLNLFFKLMVLFMVFLLLSGTFIFLFGFVFMLRNLSSLTLFILSMWFLAVWGGWLSLWGLFKGKYYLEGDFGWGELLGGKGVVSLFLRGFLYLQNWHYIFLPAQLGLSFLICLFMVL